MCYLSLYMSHETLVTLFRQNIPCTMAGLNSAFSREHFSTPPLLLNLNFKRIAPHIFFSAQNGLIANGLLSSALKGPIAFVNGKWALFYTCLTFSTILYNSQLETLPYLYLYGTFFPFNFCFLSIFREDTYFFTVGNNIRLNVEYKEKTFQSPINFINI